MTKIEFQHEDFEDLKRLRFRRNEDLDEMKMGIGKVKKNQDNILTQQSLSVLL